MYAETLDNFWKDAEIISVYTDEDAQEDGYLTDVSNHSVKFNGKTINRLTCGAIEALKFENLTEAEQKQTLEQIVLLSRFDGSGEDAWGICENEKVAGGIKLWLIPNEINGYSALLPDEY
ncbi:MAG TPA: hypothetical protein VF648_07110 [Pyrinomonadaceae bacterium]|jgi:hypothetical protein